MPDFSSLLPSLVQPVTVNTADVSQTAEAVALGGSATAVNVSSISQR